MNYLAYARLTRIEHAVMLCVAVLAGEIIALRGFPNLFLMLLTFIPPFFIEVSAFAINDYFDVEVDRKNKRIDRPLVSGEISVNEALWLAIISAVIGVGAAYFINFNCFVIAFLFAAVSFAYSYKLKDWGLIGNSYVGLTMAIPFLFGNFAVSLELSNSVIILALISFIAGIAREVTGAVRDVEGDRLRANTATFPMIVGEATALQFSSVLYAIAIVLSFIPFLFMTSFPEYAGDLSYLLMIGVCDVILGYIAAMQLSDPSEQFLQKARYLSLGAMFVGLVAFLAGAIY